MEYLRMTIIHKQNFIEQVKDVDIKTLYLSADFIISHKCNIFDIHLGFKKDEKWTSPQIHINTYIHTHTHIYKYIYIYIL